MAHLLSPLHHRRRRRAPPPSPTRIHILHLPSYPAYSLPCSHHHRQRHRSVASSHASSSSEVTSYSTTSTSSTRKLAASLRKRLSCGKEASQKKSSWRTPSVDSTPCSSCSSSINNDDGLFLSASPASSANTSPAISRVNTRMDDYQSMLEETRKDEALEELQRQRDIHVFFAQADTETTLRRF